MPKITITTVDVTMEQLAALLKGQSVVQPEPYFAESIGIPRIENPSQYLRTPGQPTGTGPGRPYKLTDEGLKKVWELSKTGYTPTKISQAFGGIISEKAVRKLIQKIKAS